MSTQSESSSNFKWDWNLPRLFIRRCREKGAALKVADSSGVKLSGNDLLLRTLALKRIIDRVVLRASFTNLEDEKHVGVLLPPTVPAVCVNMALTLSRRVAVNLNYTVSESIINRCIEQAGIKHVLTSRKVIEKLGVKLNAEVVYLEDLKEKATLADKIVENKKKKKKKEKKKTKERRTNEEK